MYIKYVLYVCIFIYLYRPMYVWMCVDVRACMRVYMHACVYNFMAFIVQSLSSVGALDEGTTSLLHANNILP